jgi:GNAT superfamily N-acetyltransferase
MAPNPPSWLQIEVEETPGRVSVEAFDSRLPGRGPKERIGSLHVDMRRTAYAPRHDWWGRPSVEIARVVGAYVGEAYRREGVATAMYQAAAERAAARGLHLASDTSLSRMASGFWRKQARKGRARKTTKLAARGSRLRQRRYVLDPALPETLENPMWRNPDEDIRRKWRGATGGRGGPVEAAAWVRERMRRGEKVRGKELVELGLAEGLERLPYDKKRDKYVIDTLHKTFNRDTNMIGRGQVWANTQSSNVIRAFNDVWPDSGRDYKPGDLQAFDLRNFRDLDPYVHQFVVNRAKDQGLFLYRFHTYGRDRGRAFTHGRAGNRVVQGYVIATLDDQLVGVFSRRNAKAVDVIEKVMRVVSWWPGPLIKDLFPLPGPRRPYGGGAYFSHLYELNPVELPLAEQIFRAWLPPDVRRVIEDQEPGWQAEADRWRKHYTLSGIHREVRARWAQGERFGVYDHERHLPLWLQEREPLDPRSHHDFEWGS